MCCIRYASHPPQWKSLGRLSDNTKTHDKVECKHTLEPPVGVSFRVSGVMGNKLYVIGVLLLPGFNKELKKS